MVGTEAHARGAETTERVSAACVCLPGGDSGGVSGFAFGESLGRYRYLCLLVVLVVLACFSPSSSRNSYSLASYDN